MLLFAFVSRVNVFKRRGIWVWGEGMLELIYIVSNRGIEEMVVFSPFPSSV